MNTVVELKGEIEGPGSCDGGGVWSNSLELTFGRNKISK